MRLQKERKGKWASRAAAMLALRVLNIAIGLATVTLFARLMDVKDYGTYILVVTLVQFLSLPLAMGLPTLLTREISIGIAAGDVGVVRGIQAWSVRAVFFVTLALLVIALLASLLEIIPTTFGAGSQATTLILLCWATVPINAELMRSAGILSGFKRVVFGRLPESLIRPLLVLIAGGFALSAASPRPEEMVAIYFLSTLATACAAHVFVRRSQPGNIHNVPPVFKSGIWLRQILPLTAIAGVAMVKNYSDILMLGALSNTESVAIYRVGSQLGTLAQIFSVIGIALLSPHASAFYSQGQIRQLQALAAMIGRYSAAGTGIFVVLLVIFGNAMIPMLFGSTYSGAYLISVILAVGAMATSLFGVGLQMLVWTQREATAAQLGFAAVIANILLNLALIQPLGGAGAAIATALTNFIMAFSAWRIVQRRLALRVDVLASLRPKFMAP